MLKWLSLPKKHPNKIIPHGKEDIFDLELEIRLRVEIP